jgi:hypothetical protein
MEVAAAVDSNGGSIVDGETDDGVARPRRSGLVSSVALPPIEDSLRRLALDGALAAVANGRPLD